MATLLRVPEEADKHLNYTGSRTREKTGSLQRNHNQEIPLISKLKSHLLHLMDKNSMY